MVMSAVKNGMLFRASARIALWRTKTNVGAGVVGCIEPNECFLLVRFESPDSLVLSRLGLGYVSNGCASVVSVDSHRKPRKFSA